VRASASTSTFQPETSDVLEPDILAPLIRRWERRCPLSSADRAAIIGLPATRKTFPRDAYIVREGEAPGECGLLLKGFAYRQKIVRGGSRQIISIHIPGEFVDLQNCLLGEADHNVQALNEAELALVPKAALSELASTHPAIGRAMWLDTLIDSSVFREWVVNVGRRDAKTRIAHLLCELSLRLQASGTPKERSCEFPLTQEQLGDATGLTAVHTNRVLQSLRQDGLISLTSRTLTILDWSGLRDAGEFSERYLHHAA
jgi:CRP-like cAMP-binding protein